MDADYSKRQADSDEVSILKVELLFYGLDHTASPLASPEIQEDSVFCRFIYLLIL